MAESWVIILCFFLTFSLISTVQSRTFSLPTTTTIPTTSDLDVSDSINKTLNVLSIKPIKPNALQSLTQSDFSSSSTLSLKIHTRSSVHKSSHKDYNSLVKARLARDSSRVNSLQTRIHLAVNGIKTTSDLNEFISGEKELDVPVISGTSHGSGEYFTRVGIGHPPSQVYMVLDTGSDVNWLQCAPCADCYQQTDPIFQPTSSSSYSQLTCDADQCHYLDISECRNNTCTYEVSYGDGSYTVGDFVTETVTLSDSVEIKDVAIGCGHNNEGLFVGAAGLIGLGGGRLSFPSQINATSYSYCLVDRDSDSTSTLDFNSPIPSDAVTAPLLRNDKIDTFYYVDLTDLSVAGNPLHIPATTFKLTGDGGGGVIIDSGTAVTRLQTAAYNLLRDSFVNATKGLTPVAGVSLFDTCFDFSKMKNVEVPTVSFHFSNGEELALPAKNYLIPVDSSGTFCFAFAATSSSMSIIGNVQQQGTRVSYDLERSVFGFSVNKC